VPFGRLALHTGFIVRRFYAEAEAAAKLDHPHMVPAYEVGEANGQHFYSMAFVGRLRPSARGLLDIHGDLFEWCHNWLGEYGAGPAVADPTGPAEGSFRMYRGGGWLMGAAGCRSASRDWVVPTGRAAGLGFRVAAVPCSPASESGNQAASDAGSGSRAAE
jgi:formylglycine-generating enzyme required for sulfatase activity